MSRKNGLLAYLNSLPFPLTIKHYFPFDAVTEKLKDGALNSSESWDVLRQSHDHFSISESREEWLKTANAIVKKDGQDGGLLVRAKDVERILERLKITSVFSAGVGGAGLEYQLKVAQPSLKLICSEYSPVNVEALKMVFLECDEILLFDVKTSDWSIALRGVEPQTQLCLLYRVDIHLTNEEWKEAFRNMHNAGIKNVLFIVSGCVTARGLLNIWKARLQSLLRGSSQAFAGYKRSKVTFTTFWRGLYATEELECGGLQSFLLRRVD